jgi:hypothetical protein
MRALVSPLRGWTVHGGCPHIIGSSAYSTSAAKPKPEPNQDSPRRQQRNQSSEAVQADELA